MIKKIPEKFIEHRGYLFLYEKTYKTNGIGFN